jgi:hypothetical protein
MVLYGLGAEHVVGHGEDSSSLDQQLATPNQAERFGDCRLVEGLSDWRPPLDDDRVTLVVFDVTSTDVPALAVSGVDSAEAQGSASVGQEPHPSLEGPLEIRILATPDERFGSLPHRRQAGVRRVDVGLLVFELAVFSHAQTQSLAEFNRLGVTTGG